MIQLSLMHIFQCAASGFALKKANCDNERDSAGENQWPARPHRLTARPLGPPFLPPPPR